MKFTVHRIPKNKEELEALDDYFKMFALAESVEYFNSVGYKISISMQGDEINIKLKKRGKIK